MKKPVATVSDSIGNLVYTRHKLNKINGSILQRVRVLVCTFMRQNVYSYKEQWNSEREKEIHARKDIREIDKCPDTLYIR